MRMVERGGRLRLALEAAARIGVGDLAGEELDCDRPVQLRVERAIDLTHAAFAEQRLDAVGSYLRPCAEMYMVQQVTILLLRAPLAIPVRSGHRFARRRIGDRIDVRVSSTGQVFARICSMLAGRGVVDASAYAHWARDDSHLRRRSRCCTP